MQKKWCRLQIRSYWNSKGPLWWSALGSGSKKSLGGRLVESVKDCVWLSCFPTSNEARKF